MDNNNFNPQNSNFNNGYNPNQPKDGGFNNNYNPQQPMNGTFNNDYDPNQPQSGGFNNDYAPQPPKTGTFNNPNTTQNYQQNFGQQPYYGGSQIPQGPIDPGKGLATASLVCGIVGLFLNFLSLFFFVAPLLLYIGIAAIIPDVIAIILAVISGNKSASVGLKRNGMSLAGLICGIVSAAFSIISLGCIVCLCSTFLQYNTTYYGNRYY